jgi:hypothetical protein
MQKCVPGRPEDVPLEPKPIEPSWILSGEPRARAGSHSRNTDGWAETLHWDCTAGRFRWHFGWEETVVILEGEVRVTDAAGTETTLRAGDVAYFPADSWFTWEVGQYVRKIAFCRKPVARPLRLLARAIDKLVALRPARLRAFSGKRGDLVARLFGCEAARLMFGFEVELGAQVVAFVLA